MDIVSYSSKKITNFFIVNLAAYEVEGLLSNHENLSAAARAGAFAPANPSATDPVTVEINPDGSAVVIILVIRNTIDDIASHISS